MRKEEIEPMLLTKWLGKEIYCREEVSSTNILGKELAEKGAPHGTVVVAEQQTAGRGRRGRKWVAPKGAGLWFSMVLKPDIKPDCASALTLVAAISVTTAIEAVSGLTSQIKWPNDVLLSGKKVCGILTEMSAKVDYVNHIVVGIGINVGPQNFPEEFAEHASFLEKESKGKVSREELLATVLEKFENYYELYLQTMDLSLIMEEYNSHLVNQGKPVRVLDAKEPYEGIARGINQKGELLVEHQGQIQPVNSGEVSVRGIYGYV